MFFAGSGNSRNGGARTQNLYREPNLSESDDGDENVSDEPQFDAMSIINSAFDPDASIKKSFTLAGNNPRPRKPCEPEVLHRAVTSQRPSLQ